MCTTFYLVKRHKKREMLVPQLTEPLGQIGTPRAVLVEPVLLLLPYPARPRDEMRRPVRGDGFAASECDEFTLYVLHEVGRFCNEDLTWARCLCISKLSPCTFDTCDFVEDSRRLSMTTSEGN